jgi:alanine racemase
MDMVRPGINLYGFNREKAEKCGVSLKPSMLACSNVITVKTAASGESIGYKQGV